ncbi:MAG: DUF5010 domain-containing protein [Pirellulales bacterium]
MRQLVHFGTLCAILLIAIAIVAPTRAEPVVGAYYYPWYNGSGNFTVSPDGGRDISLGIRGITTPQQTAAIGSYSSFDASAVSAQIDQSHRGNIDFWALSWWGPNSYTDRAIRETILPHPRASELQYAIHYESEGRLGSYNAPNYSNLIDDFRFLANNYFSDPNYLRIDGRPVVFMYLTRAFFNEQVSSNVVASLHRTIQREFGVDPYIVGDDVFTDSFDPSRAQLWDAVTNYDVYGNAMRSIGSTSEAITRTASVYDEAIAGLAGSGVGFIPAATPGFNDSLTRAGHPTAPRYFVDDSNSQPGDVFQKMLEDVAVPRVDPNAGNLLMINSFNEWHEDTQIEQSVVTASTKNDLTGVQRFTSGYAYEGYGARYLDILREATSDPASMPLDSVDMIDNASFVHGLYQSLLHRPADGAGLDRWMETLDGGESRGDVVERFLNSRERLARVVDEYYRSLLDRTADTGGLEFWVNRIASGGSGSDVVVSFLTSPEYTASHRSNADFVRGLYEDILHRQADTDGLRHFVDQLRNGRTREELIRSFLASPERSHAIIDGLYRELLGRGVGPVGLDAFSTMIQTGQGDLNDVVTALLTSDEFLSNARRRLDSSQWYYWYNVGLAQQQSQASTLGTAAIPEPSAAALTVLAFSTFLLASRSRQAPLSSR